MFSAADLPETLPIFPLPGALLLPRTRLPLHIFEPRYLAMLDDVLKTSQRLIGMIQPLGGTDADDDGLHQIGCAGRLSAFSETEDGRYMITLNGISRFRVLSEPDGFTPYRRCTVSWGDFSRDLGPVERDLDFDRAEFLELLSRFFEDQSVKTDWASLQGAGDELLINSLAMLCPFDVEDKQALLEAASLQGRRETLATLIEFALYGGTAEEMMQ